jgi:hypothetical protein
MARRGLDRVTVAARAESSDGVACWPRWLSDFATEIWLVRSRFQHLVLVHQALVLRLQNQNRRVAVGLASAASSSCA